MTMEVCKNNFLFHFGTYNMYPQITDQVQRKISVVLSTLLYLVHIFHLERGLFVFKKKDSMSSKFLANFHLFNSLIRPQYHDLNPFCKTLNYTFLQQEINFKLRLK